MQETVAAVTPWMTVRQTQGNVPGIDITADVIFGEVGEHALVDALVETTAANSAHIFHGEPVWLTFEVKSDRRIVDTGRVFIELECRGQPSGLATCPSQFFVLMRPPRNFSQPSSVIAHIFSTYWLQQYVEELSTWIDAADDGHCDPPRFALSARCFLDRDRPTRGLAVEVEQLLRDAGQALL